jgi:transporter family-2 protein
MNGALLSLILAVIGGALLAIQAPTNAILGKASGSPIIAAFISFLIGTVALGAAVSVSSGKLFAPALKQVPWYAWLGGFYGAFFVAIAAFGAPRVGIGVLLTAAIAGQLAAALVLDHYDLLGLARHPITLSWGLGFALVVVGAVLVRRNYLRLAQFVLIAALGRKLSLAIADALCLPPRLARLFLSVLLHLIPSHVRDDGKCHSLIHLKYFELRTRPGPQPLMSALSRNLPLAGAPESGENALCRCPSTCQTHLR